ncbi:MAG: DUF1269 domain-containing protein [Chloroflexi bacterium]|nr:DUF1269 domain-containing protein [Chloroflexota bacterium]
MADLVVLGFPSMSAADEVIPQLDSLQREQLIQLADWARVIRHDDGKVEVRQAHNTTASGAAGGALWGMIIGLIFLAPFAGALIGGAFGALSGSLRDYGIDDKFIKDLSNQIKPGTSALFLYVMSATPDKVADRLRQYQPTLLHTSLSHDSEERLRALIQPVSA